MTDAPPLIDALPTAPTRRMAKGLFSATVAAFLAALPTFRSQINTLVTWISGFAEVVATIEVSVAEANEAAATATAAANAGVAASTFAATSATSWNGAAGSKVFTLVQTGRNFAVNDRMTIIRRGDATFRARGACTAYSGTSLTVLVDDAPGAAGPYTDWLIVLSAVEAPDPAQAIGVAAGVAFAARLF